MKPWEVLINPEELALERDAYRVGSAGRKAWVAMAAAAARHAYPKVIEATIGNELVDHFGFHEDGKSLDGETEGMKIRRVEAWLKSPDQETEGAVADSIDPSRQLEIWEDDLRPPDDSEDSWMWFHCVGQLLAQSVTHSADGDGHITRPDSSYYWPAQVCAARCVVAAAKSINDVDAIRAAAEIPRQ
jgi:hypothetical protein